MKKEIINKLINDKSVLKVSHAAERSTMREDNE